MTDTRVWMYRKGEARLFGHPDHIPHEEGWERFPAPLGDAPPGRLHMAEPDPVPAQELTNREKLDRMSRQRLMQLAADCGVNFDTGWTKPQLKHAILEKLDDNGS
jgi:hypothetical protein